MGYQDGPGDWQICLLYGIAVGVGDACRGSGVVLEPAKLTAGCVPEIDWSVGVCVGELALDIGVDAVLVGVARGVTVLCGVSVGRGVFVAVGRGGTDVIVAVGMSVGVSDGAMVAVGSTGITVAVGACVATVVATGVGLTGAGGTSVAVFTGA